MFYLFWLFVPFKTGWNDTIQAEIDSRFISKFLSVTIIRTSTPSKFKMAASVTEVIVWPKEAPHHLYLHLEETSSHVEEEFGFTYKQKKNGEVGLFKTKVLLKSKVQWRSSWAVLIQTHWKQQWLIEKFPALHLDPSLIPLFFTRLSSNPLTPWPRLSVLDPHPSLHLMGLYGNTRLNVYSFLFWREVTPVVRCLAHLSQWLHLNGLAPVCFLKCLVSSSLRAKRHSQPSHEHL